MSRPFGTGTRSARSGRSTRGIGRALALALLVQAPTAGAAGDCCAASAAPGCETSACESAVCAEDAFCCDLAWDAVCAAQATVRCPDTCAGLDPFICYKTRRNAEGEKFEPRSVTLANAFEDKAFEVRKPGLLCNPAEVEAVPPTNSDDHLAGYRVRRAKGEPAHARVAQLEALDRFGSLGLRTVKERILLVPSAKSLGGPVAPPLDPGVEHFACYQVKRGKGAEELPKGIEVAAVDQFGQAKLFELKKPSRICIPSDKNDEGLADERHHLLCYKAKRAKGEPKHAKVGAIHVANPFGSEILDTRREEELCFASLVDAP